jgi:hypothetical protein
VEGLAFACSFQASTRQRTKRPTAIFELFENPDNMQRALVPREGAEVIRPFDLSVDRLREIYDRFARHIRAWVNNHFSTEKIAGMFCTPDGFRFGAVVVPQLGFDELVEYFNPYSGDAGPIDELGSDMDAHLQLLAWFAGETVLDTNWTPAAHFTQEKNKEQVRIFDLKDRIFSCVKHQFNSVFGRLARNTCVRIHHYWTPKTLTFRTTLRLESERELFVGQALNKTRAAITAKVNAEYEKDDLIHYEQIVSVFVDRIRAKAASRGIVLPALNTDEISIFAEFYRDAKTTGSYKLRPADAPVPITSTEVVENLCKYLDANLSVDAHGRILYTTRRSAAGAGGAAAGAGGAGSNDCNCDCQICSDEKMAIAMSVIYTARAGGALEHAMAGGKEIMYKDAMKV